MEKVFVKLLVVISLIELQRGTASDFDDPAIFTVEPLAIDNYTPATQLVEVENSETVTDKSPKVSETPASVQNVTKIPPNISVTTEQPVTNPCPDLRPDLGHLTQAQFAAELTHPCRYDKFIKPRNPNLATVHMQVDLTHMESAEQLQFKAQMLVQYMYNDSRLIFEHLSPNRSSLLGEELLTNRIWIPHVIVSNERDNRIMGVDRKDVYVSISPKGEVVYSYRVTATFYCWMNLQKFPFDSQDCALKWNSWTYNSSKLVLRWEGSNPVKIAPNLHLTEFVLSGTWAEEGIRPAIFNKGAFVGNYSELVFRFKLSREVGYYVLDYFLPSMLLVITSWVSFWLQADAAPPRVTLGTSTMLTFITLNGAVNKNLPKVSYIKASEIWFLACTFFIFCSMAEFAFVNVIWRRKKEVELKKQSSKYILKGALTPSLARKELRKAESSTSLEEHNEKNNRSHYLSTQSVPGSLKIPTITTSQDDLVSSEESIGTISSTNNNQRQKWHTMSPHEVANWIDKKARIVFPVTFLIFNVFYWSFVYAL